MTTASASTMTKLKTSLAISTSLRFARSAIAPPNTENASIGAMPIALTPVTMNDESVRSSTSHPRAIMVMKNDVMETREAAQKIRNWG